MTPSVACVELIKKWEGCYLTAYRCPADVWTIGWGSITNPFTGKDIEEGDVIDQKTADAWLRVEIDEKAAYVTSLGLTLTQSQYDALVSFAYNVGTGALGNSTLLRLLRAGDVQSAANQFDAWVHGNPGEVLPGLVSRRAEEKALFLSQSSTPAAPVNSPAKVSWYKGNRNDKGDTVIMGMAGEKAISLLTTNDSEVIVKFLIDNGKHDFRIAPAGEPIPYMPGSGTGPAPVERYLKLTRQGEDDEFGNEKLLLELVGTGKKWTVVSGQASAQTFQKGAPTNVPGTGFPLPQGKYDVGEVERGDFGAGLGPIWIAIEPKFTTPRSAFGIHLDENRWKGSPGTMGCVGVPLLSELEELCAELNDRPVAYLSVEWGV